MPDDLEVFLRRAAQRRRQRTQPKIIVLDESAETRPARPVRAEVVPEAVTVEVVEAEVAQPAGLRARHLHSELEERPQRDAHLGEEVGLADDKMAAHLKDVFDHQVGTLGEYETESVGEMASQTHPIAELLRNRQTMRQAIILSEILTPAFRRRR